MVIPLPSLPEHIFKSIVNKVEFRDLLEFAQATKFTDQYVSHNALRLQNPIKKHRLRITLATIETLEEKQHFPGSIKTMHCFLTGDLESEEMRTRFLKVCQRWGLETEYLTFTETNFFIEAVRATSPVHVVVFQGRIHDQYVLLYPEIQKLNGLDIDHVMQRIPTVFMENCNCNYLRMHLSQIEADEIRIILQRFLSGSIYLSLWKLMVNRGINPGIFYSLTAGFDIKIFWKRGDLGLPLSHKNYSHIRPSVNALFSLTNVKGETVFVKLLETELDIYEIENSENILFEAWDAIRNSSAYPL